MNHQTNAVVGDRFVPTNPCLRGILKLFSDEKTADVVFDVDGREKFYAHRLILRTCAPALADYCGGAEEDGGVASVPISDVEPDIFHHVLYYVYGGTVPEKSFRDSAREIVEAADRFGVGNLKVEAEGWYVESTPIELDNFAENFYLSDTKKCALLKEKVMAYLVENEEDALRHLSLSKKQSVPQSESMLTDFLTASARKKRKRHENDHGYELITISVSALRRELDQRGLGVDGTREILINALEKCYNAEGAIVEGAGTPEVNGFYKRAGTFHGALKYVKSEVYDGNDVEFTLSRFQYAHHSPTWYISVLPYVGFDDSSEFIGAYKCFYKADGTEYVTTPPRNGWQVAHLEMAEGVPVPAPQIRVTTPPRNGWQVAYLEMAEGVLAPAPQVRVKQPDNSQNGA